MLSRKLNSRRKLTVCLTALLIILGALTIAYAEDWPQFRGPNGSGVSTSTNLPVEFGPPDLTDTSSIELHPAPPADRSEPSGALPDQGLHHISTRGGRRALRARALE